MEPVSSLVCSSQCISERSSKKLDLDFTVSKAESRKMWVVFAGNFLGRTGFPLFYPAGFLQSYKNGIHRWPSSSTGESGHKIKFKLTTDPNIQLFGNLNYKPVTYHENGFIDQSLNDP